jgi:parvulin-like peptidyl-prolyl isomerase
MKYRNLIGFYLVSCVALNASNIQEEILVLINNNLITRNAFQKEVDVYRRAKSGDNSNVDIRLAREITLQNLIDSYALIDKANDMGLEFSDDALLKNLKSETGFTSDVELELVIKKDLGVDLKFFLNIRKRNEIKHEVIQRGVKLQVSITNKEVQDYYDEHKNKYQKVNRFRISELVLSKGTTPEEKRNTLKKVHDIQEKLDHAVDFESLVRDNSIAPSSSSGGDLGWIDTNVLHPELEAAVLTLSKKGQVTNAIELDKDIYLVKLTDIEDGGIRPFEEVRESIEANLKQIKTQQSENAYVKSITDRASVRYIVPKETILND